MNQNILSQSPQDTVDIAANFAKTVSNSDVITLNGDLGMGKTVFAKALIRALSADDTIDVPSPTFTLVQSYDGKNMPISHFDCYRLEEPEEIYEVGWEDALADGVVIIEWAEKLDALLPANRKDIIFSSVENQPKHRLIKIKESPS